MLSNLATLAPATGNYHTVGNFRKGFTFTSFMSRKPFATNLNCENSVVHVQSKQTTFQSGLLAFGGYRSSHPENRSAM